MKSIIRTSQILGRGENFEIVADARVARCRVWQRPDLSHAEGAACAEQIMRHCEQIASEGTRAFLMDLREAPPAAGPRTQKAHGMIFGWFEAAGRRVAVIVGNPIQKLQLKRLMTAAAPTHGAIFEEAEEQVALAWLQADPARSRRRR